MDVELKELSERVQTLLVEALQVPPEVVTPDLSFGDLPQWDSMGHMDVIMRLEEEFGLEVNPDTIAELINVPAIFAYLAEHVQKE